MSTKIVAGGNKSDSCCCYDSRIVHSYANLFDSNTIPDVLTTT